MATPPGWCVAMAVLLPWIVRQADARLLGSRTDAAQGRWEGTLRPGSGQVSDPGAEPAGGMEDSQSQEGQERSSSLECLQYTGGRCGYFGCRGGRGPTVCVRGLCLCVPGTCANVKGACEYSVGRSLGAHAVKFPYPQTASNAYMVVNRFGKPTLSSTPEKAWNLALSHDGFVRFESVDFPGRVLTIHQHEEVDDDVDDYERRKFSAQELGGATTLTEVEQAEAALEEEGEELDEQEDEEEKALEELWEGLNEGATRGVRVQRPIFLPHVHRVTDMWPATRPISETSPLEANFLVHEVHGGLEIWDPETATPLAAGRDIEVCHAENLKVCGQHKYVEFEPELPWKAISGQGRITIGGLGRLASWQYLLAFVLGGSLLCYACWRRDASRTWSQAAEAAPEETCESRG